MRSSLLCATLLLAVGCGSDPVTVTFAEASNGLGRFTVVSHSQQDVASLDIELSFRSSGGEVVGVDTVAYATTIDAGTGQATAFLVAGEETFFMAPMPSASVSATATVLALTFLDGTAWPELPPR